MEVRFRKIDETSRLIPARHLVRTGTGSRESAGDVGGGGRAGCAAPSRRAALAGRSGGANGDRQPYMTGQTIQLNGGTKDHGQRGSQNLANSGMTNPRGPLRSTSSRAKSARSTWTDRYGLRLTAGPRPARPRSPMNWRRRLNEADARLSGHRSTTSTGPKLSATPAGDIPLKDTIGTRAISRR